MRILLVSATEKEIQPFLQLLAKGDGSVAGNMVEILITGVGAAATVYKLTKKLSRNSFDIALHAGIAGAFNEDLKLGEVVVVQREAFGDLGTEEQGKFQTIFQSGLGDANDFPFTDGWLINEQIPGKIALPLVRSVSINKVTDSTLQKQQLISEFNPAIESMEGAAFHYVCLQENISFIQLRAISNYVGERNKKKWKLKEAIQNLNKELERIITEQ